MNEVGRYQGAQIHILKAIIQAANCLVKSQTKTILFVVKDCSSDASHQVLKEQLQNQVQSIIAEVVKTDNKSLKINLQYFFMSNYMFKKQEYQKEAEKLKSLIKVKKSNLNSYESKDRVVYLIHLWDTIVANDGQIDLRLEQEALRVYVVNRIKNQVKDQIKQQIVNEKSLGKRKSYNRFYQYFVKKGFEQIKAKLPKSIDEKMIKRQFFQLEEELQYIIQKHFTQVILPIEQKRILEQQLNEQLKKSQKSIQLQKIINEIRKKCLQSYKILIDGHKQSPILAKRFAQLITQNSVSYERQVSHLFNIFQTKLQVQIIKQLDHQIKQLKFDGQKITAKLKSLCKQFEYNVWEVNTKQLWEKTSHRVLSLKLVQKIEHESKKARSYTIQPGSKQTEIIANHKALEKKVQKFISGILGFFEQDETGQLYIERAKQKIREGLQEALIRQRKRFKISMLILGILLIFLYGEFVWFLKFIGFKKRSRNSIANFYIFLVFLILGGSIIKRVLEQQNKS